MKYKGVIFDIDCTLLNTADMNLYPLLKIIKEELNEEKTFDDVKGFLAYSGLKTLEILKINNREEVYKRWVKYVNEYDKKAFPYEGIISMLDDLNKIVKLGIVSSKMYDQYKIDMVDNGLDHYFSAVVLAEDTKMHKPDPEPLFKCLQQLGLRSDEVLYVGDTFADYQAALNANIDFALAHWGAFEIKDIAAKYDLKEPKEVIAIIEKEN